ncbi:MAG: heme-binding domain-containing protein, partial [Bdellovibrionales bacterium]|nr:heme-binding domain-containing protein [Bdellovibrionales bacterium]
KSIFKQKCFNCHGIVDALPWYAKIPGPKQLIHQDIREAKEHMDMSEGFPFQGHGTPLDDLEAIERVLEENSMPPLRYKVMHWRSGVTSKEKAVIQEWIKKGRKILNDE